MDLSVESGRGTRWRGEATIYRWADKAELVIDSFVWAVRGRVALPVAGPVLASIHEQMRRWAVIFRSPLGQIVATVIGADNPTRNSARLSRTLVEPRRVEARRCCAEQWKKERFATILSRNHARRLSALAGRTDDDLEHRVHQKYSSSVRVLSSKGTYRGP